MTNLERAAAIAAERGWPLVETYRGWAIYRTDDPDHPYWCTHPHEIDQRECAMIIRAAGGVADPQADDYLDPEWGRGLFVTALSRFTQYECIDRWEAAREAMPATAFFGVEEEVGI